MSADIRSQILTEWPELSSEQLARIQDFYERLVAENEIQNLTRLVSPEDFIQGHLLDVRELFASGLVDFPAADLGSGGGVPGLLAAAIRGDSWLLIDSEGQKARFLAETASALGLGNVEVFAKRGEDVLKTAKVGSVVARAVGPVSRIYRWLMDCSTWNNLVLLKGPSWEDEWKEFQRTSQREQLRISKTHAYTVGKEKKSRVIVKLERVPRGTKTGSHR